MKKLLLLPLLLLFFGSGLMAQIGVSVGWAKYDAPVWNQRIAELDVLTDQSPAFDQGGMQFSIDYWFRLKNKRVEFLPEISFYQLKAFLESEAQPDFGFSSDLLGTFFQFHFNTQIYPFDFEGDCDCPTFSKDGDLLKKGFFIKVAPGLSYGSFQDERSTITIAGSETVSTTENGVVPTLRAGVGLDIGLSDFLTITPFAQYTYTFKTGTFKIFDLPELPVDSGLSEIAQLHFGLRLGLRFDEMNKYGYR